MIQAISSFIGKIDPPPGVKKYIQKHPGGAVPGFVVFLSNIVKLLIIVGGIYSFINIILAGYGYLSAGGDPKRVQMASARIWQSLIGLLVVSGSFLLAAIAGYIFFDDTSAILRPKIYGP